MVVLGVCSIKIFAKNMGDPYYEPTIVVHDSIALGLKHFRNPALK